MLLNNWLDDGDKHVVGLGHQVASMRRMVDQRMIVGPGNRSSTVHWYRTTLVGHDRIPSEYPRRRDSDYGQKNGCFRRLTEGLRSLRADLGRRTRAAVVARAVLWGIDSANWRADKWVSGAAPDDCALLHSKGRFAGYSSLHMHLLEVA